MNRVIKLVVTMIALAVCAAGLAACSGGGKSTASTTSATGGAAASGSAAPSSGAAAGRGGAFADPKVQACLKGAGITLPSGAGRSRFNRPSGSNVPSGSARPSGPRPSGSGFPRTGGFGGNSAQAKKIQIALKACGITLPTGANRGRPGGSSNAGGATPSASPTS